MKCLLQRVTQASVTVAGEVVGEIERGLLVLVGVEPEDAEQAVTRMAERLLRYRVFADAEGKMNLNVAEAGGAILLVSQFTLAADTTSGNRPGWRRYPAGLAIYARRRYHQRQPARVLDRCTTRAGI